MKFHLSQDKFKEIRNQILLKVTPLVLLPFLFVFFFNPPSPTTLPFILILCIAVMGFSLFSTIKRYKKAWETFELTIEADRIERSQANYPLISLSKNDIIEAIESANGSITIVAKNRAHSILVPGAVESKDKFIEAISSFTQIRKAQNKNYLKLLYGIAIAGIFLMIAFMSSSNLYIILPTGIILLAGFLWGFVELQRNKNYDKKLKRYSYAIFFLL